MSQICVHVVFSVKDVEKFLALVPDIIRATRKEEGCIAYERSQQHSATQNLGFTFLTDFDISRPGECGMTKIFILGYHYPLMRAIWSLVVVFMLKLWPPNFLQNQLLKKVFLMSQDLWQFNVWFPAQKILRSMLPESSRPKYVPYRMMLHCRYQHVVFMEILVRTERALKMTQSIWVWSCAKPSNK